jgi:2-polyprenyl-3-methyl-5-hydroxy-6-metoxy-1,4-benzoquinol methylase
MESIQQHLIDFSNQRSENKFKNYEDYINYQTKQGLSFEKDNVSWTEGQKKCINDHFKNTNRESKILDVCCGDGRGLQQFKDMGFINITGVEISDEKIHFAKEINKTIIKRDICCGPFDFGENYDVIYSSHTIEHVLHPEYTIKNLMNLLKDDGKCIIILPYPDIEASNPYNDSRFKIHCGVIPLGLHINDNGKTTIDIITNMGFKVINVNFNQYREPEIHLTIVKG